jgi:hypothetical protein
MAKSNIAADYAAVETSEDGTQEQHVSMSGRRSDIVFSAVVTTVPIIILSGSLLALVFDLRVIQEPSIFAQGQQGQTSNEAGVYYVRISSTYLVFIASLSSSVVPMLATFLLTLASFLIANDVREQTHSESHIRSLTPYQFALTLNFLSGGGYGAIWRWVKYLFTQRKARERRAKALTQAAWFTLLALLLGYCHPFTLLSKVLADLNRLLVILADTWLHIATNTVAFTQLLSTGDPTAYGFGLQEACTTNNNSLQDPSFGPCTISRAVTNTFLVNGTQSLQVLNNVSSLATVSTINDGQNYAFLAVPPSIGLADEDWRAESFALQTQCRLASKECNLHAEDGAATPFNCSNIYFYGDVSSVDNQNFIAWFFSDGTMSNDNTDAGVGNPFYFGMAGLVNPSTGDNSAIPDTAVPLHGGAAFVVLCNTTVLDVTYNSINGTISDFKGTLSNASTANIWQSVMAYTTVGWDNLKQAASLAALGNSNQKFADDMALSFSQIALAIGAQSVEKRPVLAVQKRYSFLVARVPAAPLYVLVGANMLVVLVTTVLTVIALVVSKGEVKEVQSRLSIFGLVADRFEGKTASLAVKDIDELFRESKGQKTSSIGITRAAEGGFVYKTWGSQ